MIGLAFKENTDDLRESPVVTLLEQLIGKGRAVQVFDPHVRLEAIYGSNRNYILETIPHIGRLLTGSLDQILGWADHLVLAQKQARGTTRANSSEREFRCSDLMQGWRRRRQARAERAN